MIKLKKILLLALATVMTVGISVSAEVLTTTESLKGATVPVTGSTEVPTISVTVPTSASFIVNPFGMSVTDGTATSQKQVVSTTFAIESASEVKVDVFLDKFTTLIEGGTEKINLVTAPVLSTTTTTTKDLFLFLEKADFTLEKPADTKKIVPKTNTTTALNVNMGTLAEGTVDATSKLELKFFGNANAKAAWSDTDTITVTPTFRFVPQMAATVTP